MALLSRCRLGQMRDTSVKHGQALIVDRAKQVWQMKADYAPGTPPWQITSPARRTTKPVNEVIAAACRGRKCPRPKRPATPPGSPDARDSTALSARRRSCRYARG